MSLVAGSRHPSGGRALGPDDEEEPVKLGYKLFAEAFSPTELVGQAVRAEEAGFGGDHRAAQRRPLHPGRGGRGAAQRARRGPGGYPGARAASKMVRTVSIVSASEAGLSSR